MLNDNQIILAESCLFLNEGGLADKKKVIKECTEALATALCSAFGAKRDKHELKITYHTLNFASMIQWYIGGFESGKLFKDTDALKIAGIVKRVLNSYPVKVHLDMEGKEFDYVHIEIKGSKKFEYTENNRK